MSSTQLFRHNLVKLTMNFTKRACFDEMIALRARLFELQFANNNMRLFYISTGFGNIAPRTTLGRIVTMVYAILGIPLTLIYLSSTGGVLARVARGIFSR